MAHLDIVGIEYTLADGRPLLSDVSFRVGEGARVALIGANGAGKTTLLRLITGDLSADAGAITQDGTLG
ncbi:MAG: ATP-binding cassette domain-containing protein, partial [Brachybacterium tyrofermentans]